MRTARAWAANGSYRQLIPIGRTARLVEVDGKVLAESDTVVSDDDVIGLVDPGRR